MATKTQFKKGSTLMYQFLNTPDKMSALIQACNLTPSVGTAGLAGAAEVYGEDLRYPNVIHFYPAGNPRVMDPYRLFILDAVAFKYKEVV